MHSNSFPPQILTLHFVVLSFDRYSRDDVVGEVMVELEGMDLSGSETCPLSLAREITPRSDKLRSQGRGELLVSLCHQVMSTHFLILIASLFPLLISPKKRRASREGTKYSPQCISANLSRRHRLSLSQQIHIFTSMDIQSLGIKFA